MNSVKQPVYLKLLKAISFLCAFAIMLSPFSAQADDDKMLINMSNMASEKDLAYVEKVLLESLNENDVRAFIDAVKDYNQTTQNIGLNENFTLGEKPSYDIEESSKLWQEKKGDFVGTNCRINTFNLVKSLMGFKPAKPNDGLLFMDKDAIAEGKLFDQTQENQFLCLFSKVKTSKTKNIKTHGKVMEHYFKNFTFPKNADILMVVIHDNLDGNYLFVGHVGVLVKDGDGFLFVEKLSFDEPYQAIKFKTKDEAYKYLYQTYKHYTDPTTAKPFIMDNGKMVNPKVYEK